MKILQQNKNTSTINVKNFMYIYDRIFGDFNGRLLCEFNVKYKDKQEILGEKAQLIIKYILFIEVGREYD